MSRLISIGHVLVWTQLVLLLIFARPQGSDEYKTYLSVLLLTNLVSLAFDYVDLVSWLFGDRSVPGA